MLSLLADRVTRHPLTRFALGLPPVTEPATAAELNEKLTGRTKPPLSYIRPADVTKHLTNAQSWKYRPLARAYWRALLPFTLAQRRLDKMERPTDADGPKVHSKFAAATARYHDCRWTKQFAERAMLDFNPRGHLVQGMLTHSRSTEARALREIRKLSRHADVAHRPSEQWPSMTKSHISYLETQVRNSRLLTKPLAMVRRDMRREMLALRRAEATATSLPASSGQTAPATASPLPDTAPRQQSAQVTARALVP